MIALFVPFLVMFLALFCGIVAGVFVYSLVRTNWASGETIHPDRRVDGRYIVEIPQLRYQALGAGLVVFLTIVLCYLLLVSTKLWYFDKLLVMVFTYFVIHKGVVSAFVSISDEEYGVYKFMNQIDKTRVFSNGYHYMIPSLFPKVFPNIETLTPRRYRETTKEFTVSATAREIFEPVGEEYLEHVKTSGEARVHCVLSYKPRHVIELESIPYNEAILQLQATLANACELVFDGGNEEVVIAPLEPILDPNTGMITYDTRGTGQAMQPSRGHLSLEGALQQTVLFQQRLWEIFNRIQEGNYFVVTAIKPHPQRAFLEIVDPETSQLFEGRAREVLRARVNFFAAQAKTHIEVYDKSTVARAIAQSITTAITALPAEHANVRNIDSLIRRTYLAYGITDQNEKIYRADIDSALFTALSPLFGQLTPDTLTGLLQALRGIHGTQN